MLLQFSLFMFERVLQIADTGDYRHLNTREPAHFLLEKKAGKMDERVPETRQCRGLAYVTPLHDARHKREVTRLKLLCVYVHIWSLVVGRWSLVDNYRPTTYD